MKSFTIAVFLFFTSSTALAGEMKADHIQRDPYGGISASGDVYLQAKDFDIQAESLKFDLDAMTGEMKQATVHFDQGYTFKGHYLQRIDLEKFKGKNIEFSACPEDAWAWAIFAEEATLDREAGTFIAKNAWFEWGGVPVMYFPRWFNALTRRSGFLIPEFLQSSRRGTEYIIPYYLAGAPNWDITLRPHWMSLRGLMADIEWRHRSAIGSEMLQVRSIFDKKTHKQRSRLRSDMDWALTQSIHLSVKADVVDDGLHVSDFPLFGEKESMSYLTSTVVLGWKEGRDSAAFSGRYQQALGTANRGSLLQVMPRLQTQHYFDLGSPQSFSLAHQTTKFRHNTGAYGLRSGVRPSWSIPWTAQDGAIEATWSVMGQAVYYDSQNFTDPHSSYQAVASSLELASAFERVSAMKQWRHEIKPILRFDVSSASDQSQYPNYDSSMVPLSMSNLMHGNRYSGWDRFERMRRVSVLLASSLQKKTEQGEVRTVLEGQVGMSWDGLQESVDKTLTAAPSQGSSNILAEASWLPYASVKVAAGGQYDSSVSQWVESHAVVSWTGQEQQYFNVLWQRTLASHSVDAEMVGAQGKVQLDKRWSSHVSIQYDLFRKHTLETVAGFSYRHACWNLLIERFQNYQVGSNGATDVGARFLLAFDGLGSFADK